MQNMVEGSRKEKKCAVCVWDMVNVLKYSRIFTEKDCSQTLGISEHG